MTAEQRLVVDRITCDGHGVCADLLPEMIQLDDWGYPIIDSRPVPNHLVAHARRAVKSCPMLALRLHSQPFLSLRSGRLHDGSSGSAA